MKKALEILENSPVSIVVTEHSERKFVYVNDAFCHIVGYSREQLIGKRSTDLNIITLDKQEETIRLAEANGGIITGNERIINRSDGQQIPIYYSVKKVEEEGKLFWVSTILDISERIAKEEEIFLLSEKHRKSESKFKTFLETLPEANVIFDQDGIIKLVNTQTEQLFGYNREELIEKKVELWFPEDPTINYLPLREAYFKNPCNKVIGKEFGLLGKRKDGTNFHAEVSLSPVESETEDCIYISASIRDVSYQKKIARQLTDKNEAIEYMTRMMIHDFKNPLGNIQVVLDMILKEDLEKLNPKFQPFIPLALDEISFMKTLIKNLTEYIQIGQTDEQLEIVDLNVLIMDQIIKYGSQTISIDLLSELPSILFSKTQITQVFTNLISNAVKFMDKPQGEIRINVTDKVWEWQFSISDNGVGIEDKNLKKIFEVFNKTNFKPDVESTGIGLSIVKRIIENAGGSIWVESEKGVGSKFYFTIPKAPEIYLASACDSR